MLRLGGPPHWAFRRTLCPQVRRDYRKEVWQSGKKAIHLPDCHPSGAVYFPAQAASMGPSNCGDRRSNGPRLDKRGRGGINRVNRKRHRYPPLAVQLIYERMYGIMPSE